MTDRVYIHPLREGSDDCWDGFAWEGDRYWATMCGDRYMPRYCAVWVGTSDREVLECLK